MSQKVNIKNRIMENVSPKKIYLTPLPYSKSALQPYISVIVSSVLFTEATDK